MPGAVRFYVCDDLVYLDDVGVSGFDLDVLGYLLETVVVLLLMLLLNGYGAALILNDGDSTVAYGLVAIGIV